MLSELDDRLSTVKRWGIMKTIQKQSVAEHCFNVQRICMRIAPWFGITSHEELFLLSQAALHHDDYEAITGDIPSTAKEFLTESETGVDMPDLAWYDDRDDHIKAIVKLADLLEAFHFLTLEIKMGNRYIVRHKVRLRNIIDNYIKTHGEWPGKIMDVCYSWMLEIEHTISDTYR